MEHKVIEIGIGERFRAIRRHLDINASAMARRLGVSPSYYSAVERGLKKPSIEMLQGIGRDLPQVDTRWLLCGAGNMLHSVAPTQGSPAAAPQPIEDALIRELQELRELATRSSQATAQAILVALGQAGTPLSRTELAARCQMSVVTLGPDLTLLKRLGLLLEDSAGVRPAGWRLSAGNPAETAELALRVIDIVLRRVLPAADRGDGTGRLLIVDAAVADARHFIEELRDLARERLNVDDGTERVTLVLGAYTLRRDDP